VCDKIIQRLHDQCVVMLNQDSFYRSLTEVRGNLLMVMLNGYYDDDER
jgi:uridine kinase